MTGSCDPLLPDLLPSASLGLVDAAESGSETEVLLLLMRQRENGARRLADSG